MTDESTAELLPSESLSRDSFELARVLLVMATGASEERSSALTKLAFDAYQGVDRSVQLAHMFADELDMQVAFDIRGALEDGVTPFSLAWLTRVSVLENRLWWGRRVWNACVVRWRNLWASP